LPSSAGGTGIGVDVTHALAAEGFKVVMAGRCEGPLHDVADRVRESIVTPVLAVRYLISPEARYVTGQTLGINGGSVVGR
jgi:NAD(P)-dependent dehydrogenase (short-subunit alcohol dehydrogenase family)